jgi:hypothetical protein
VALAAALLLAPLPTQPSLPCNSSRPTTSARPAQHKACTAVVPLPHGSLTPDCLLLREAPLVQAAAAEGETPAPRSHNVEGGTARQLGGAMGTGATPAAAAAGPSASACKTPAAGLGATAQAPSSALPSGTGVVSGGSGLNRAPGDISSACRAFDVTLVGFCPRACTAWQVTKAVRTALLTE